MDRDVNGEHEKECWLGGFEKRRQMWNEKDKVYKERCGARSVVRKSAWESEEGERRKSPRGGERGGWLEEESLARLITSGSKFPANHFYNTWAILLKEEAIRLRPTFHLRLTFMSSTQFYHSECNVYLSADAILPCYYLNSAGLIIISRRANMLPQKPTSSFYSAARFSFCFAAAVSHTELVFYRTNDCIFLHEP